MRLSSDCKVMVFNIKNIMDWLKQEHRMELDEYDATIALTYLLVLEHFRDCTYARFKYKGQDVTDDHVEFMKLVDEYNCLEYDTAHETLEVFFNQLYDQIDFLISTPFSTRSLGVVDFQDFLIINNKVFVKYLIN